MGGVGCGWATAIVMWFMALGQGPGDVYTLALTP